MDNSCVKYYKHLKEISEDWDRIFRDSKRSYFCSLSWHAVVLSFFQQAKLTKKLNEIRYFTVHKEKKAQAEASGFFYIRTGFGKRTLHFTHLLGPSDYYDFMYKEDLDSLVIKQIITNIAKDNNISDVSFSHIKKKSKLYDALSLFESFHFQSLKCVAIKLEDSYEAHIKTLSKSVRQNLRTANNRIRKSEMIKDIAFLTQKDVDSIDFKQLKAIYKKRNKVKVQNTNWKTKLYRLLDDPFRKEIDMFDIDAIKSTDFLLGTLKLNNTIAAYFFGLKNSSGIEINRVAIDDDFRRYSPGMVLLDEFIKKGFELGLQTIDLTVGDEKYKYDLGGETHEIINAKGKVCLD